MPKVNFQLIKERALGSIDNLVSQWLPQGKREGVEWVATNPTRTDGSPGSFKVNLSTGVWCDWAQKNAKGGDLIALYAYLNGLEQIDAAKELAKLLNISDEDNHVEPRPPAASTSSQPTKPGKEEWAAIIPIPTSAPPAPPQHYKHGKPSKRWLYRDLNGKPLMMICRFDKKGGGKEFCPLTFCKKGNDEQWRWKSLPAPRPLYRLDNLAARPDAEVVICEGEKAADAAQKLFPDAVCMTSPNGSQSAKKADWEVLKGRTVIVWPDYDPAGTEYMGVVAKCLTGIADKLLKIKLPLTGSPLPGGALEAESREPEKGWDAFDAVQDGWADLHIKALIEANSLYGQLFHSPRGKGNHGALVMPDQLHLPNEKTPELNRDRGPINADTGQPWPEIRGGWFISNDGVQEPGKSFEQPGGLITMRPIWVEACTVQRIGLEERWGVYIKFYDMAWKLKSHAFPMRRMSEQGGILGQELLDMGLPVVAGKEKMLSRYLGVQTSSVDHVRSTSKLGWLDDEDPMFVMPNQVIGGGEDKIIYQSDAPNMEYLAYTLHAKGKLAEWKEHVAEPCTNNPLLMFALMLGLAPPLMRFCEVPSGGFHLAGSSTTGKTTALQVAVTAWGCGADPQSGPSNTAIRRWKSTGNALEAVAELHNHMLLALDEINEVDPRELGGIIYQLAGGQSKGRSTLHGGLRAPRHWQLLYLSTGERSISDMLKQAGHSLQGGQAVRLPEIPAEDPLTGKPSIIEDAHGKTPREHAEKIKAACSKYYGTAGPTLAGWFISQIARIGYHQFVGQLRQELQTIENTLIERLTKSGERLTTENRRSLKQFTVTLLAGMHASNAGILDWTMEQIFIAGEIVITRWLRDQGEERTEVERAISHLRDSLISSNAQFINYDYVNSSNVREVLGFEYEDYYLITSAGFKQLIGNYDARMILQELAKRKFLSYNKGRYTKRAPSIKSLGGARPPLYWIDKSFLDGEDDGTTPSGKYPPASQQRMELEEDDDLPI